MTGYRAMRFGRHVELILTDFHSYTMEDPTSRNEADAFSSEAFPDFFPLEAMQILDAGRTYAGGNPPQSIQLGAKSVQNFARNDPPMTVLGREQKARLSIRWRRRKPRGRFGAQRTERWTCEPIRRTCRRG